MNQTEQIFCNGPIVTLEEGPAPQAVLVRGERIAALGSRAELEAMAPGALRRDLEGRALLPAFLDAHSHITAVAATLDLCPLGSAASFADIVGCCWPFRRSGTWPRTSGSSASGTTTTCSRSGPSPTGTPWTTPSLRRRCSSPTPRDTWERSTPPP